MSSKAYELAQIANNLVVDAAGTITNLSIDTTNIDSLVNIDLAIAPEILEIQVAAPAAGQDIAWLWTWETSSLPYARRTITNSPELSVPLYKQGTYTVNNYAAYDLFDQMTQTHTLYFKWIDSAGTDNLVSWANSTGPVSDSHPDINGGNPTQVQRINIVVPANVTPPTLTAPNVSYTVTNSGTGAYTFSGSASGNNPNIGPFYRGGTYTFNVNASGHPFYLTTDNGTNFSSGTYFGEYTTGVTGSRTDVGTVTITVPADAPDTLYYQCGNHAPMRGAITVKNLAVETNINGNYVIYAMHTQEGHKTPVEIRPIPSLVNQMCLVFDASRGKFVPQDLATYVENTPSFENKIREVAGTAELVVEDGSAVIAKVNVYDDSTYLPLTGNNPGDQAFATDTDILYIWDGSAWQQAGASNSDDLTEGSTNLFYTDARVDARVALVVDAAPAQLDTLNELAAALNDDANFATTVTNSIATKLAIADFDSTFDTRLATKTTTDVVEGTNLYYTDARVQTVIDTNTAGFITSADGGNAATIDGLDSTQFLRSDTDDTTTGSLTVTGDYIGVPVAAADPSSTGVGQIYYSTTANALRNYTGAQGGWQNVSVQPPKVTNVTGIINEDTSSTITITGENFSTGSVVKITGAGVSDTTRSLVTTFVNETTLTADTNASNVPYVGGASFGVLVENLSGLTGEWASTGNIDRDPVFTAPTAGASIAVNDRHDGAEYSTYTDGSTTYRVVQFKAGAGNWVSTCNGSCEILLVGGGGGGGIQVGGGGGGGQVLYGTTNLTGGETINYSVGMGGTGGGYSSDNGYTSSSGTPGTMIPSTNGFPTIFGAYTANGGGGGGSHNVGTRLGAHMGDENGTGKVGGSGGGGAGNSATQDQPGGSSNKTTYAGFTSHGNSGGLGRASNWAGGGGGGAGGNGQGSPTGDTGGDGGIGVAYDLTGTNTYYGGGGGGCWSNENGPTNTVPGGGGRGTGNYTQVSFGTNHGENGQENTGGGGGGCRDRVTNSGNFVTHAGHGGSGIIVLRYPIANESNSNITAVTATDPDGDAVTVTTSSNLGGSTLTQTAIAGYPSSVGGQTTYPITVQADSNGQTETRSFNIIVNPVNDGSSASRAASSAEAIKTLTGTTQDGIYYININGTATPVWCDMNTNNGGWMQAMNINTRDGHIVHWSNWDFWESATETTSYYSAAYDVRAVPQGRPNHWNHWYQDWKAINDGNLWNNFNGSKILVVIHTNGSYLGWRSWNLNTGTVTRFGQFWQGGQAYGGGSINPTGGQVRYQRKITNGEIASSVGSINSNEPLLRNGVDLVANAMNNNFDLNRVTITTSSGAGNTDSTGNYPVGDNSGGGLGTYYDRDAGGRPECDGQIFNTATWSSGRIGDDHLNDGNFSSWGGKYYGATDTYNWNSGSGLAYDYAFFIK